MLAAPQVQAFPLEQGAVTVVGALPLLGKKGVCQRFALDGPHAHAGPGGGERLPAVNGVVGEEGGACRFPARADLTLIWLKSIPP